jgi:hypothetical protein
MGMTDDVTCDFPLPESAHQGLRYQTKDLLSLHQTFHITMDGRLIQDARHSVPSLARDMEWPLDQDLEFHTQVQTPNGREWISYVAHFRNGRVEWITRQEEAPTAPKMAP